MQTWLKDSIREVRRLSAQGDFAAARARVDDAMARAGSKESASLLRPALTLEVLEGLDIVTRLLQGNDAAGAASAADTILGVLERDEYARLGIAGAAQSLLHRAAELARRIDGGDRTALTREETEAFLEHAGREIVALERETVARQLAALEPDAQDAGASTLGDLLSHRPFRSGISRPVGSVRESRRASTRAEAGRSAPRRMAAAPERPSGGVPPAPPQAAAETGDVFETASRAVFEYWHVVLFGALLFAAFGYFGVVSTPDRFTSTAELLKRKASTLRAPITNRPDNFAPSLPLELAKEMTRWPQLMERVAETLAVGWATEEGGPKRRWLIEPDEIAGMLSANVRDTSDRTYVVSFTARHHDARTAQAIAGAAAHEFRALSHEYIIGEATAILADYEEMQLGIANELSELQKRRLAEFQTENVEAVGATIEERIRNLMQRLQSERTELEASRIALKSAQQKLAAEIFIAERLPEFEQAKEDPRIDERKKNLNQLETELRQLSRRAETFGPEHPDRKKISDMNEEAELLRAEIEAMEEAHREANRDLPLHRERAIAESRVSTASAQVTLIEDQVALLEERVPRLEAELTELREGKLASEELRLAEDDLLERRDTNAKVIDDVKAVKASANREFSISVDATRPRLVPKEKALGIGLGVVLGLLVGTGAAVGLQRRSQRREAT